MGAGISSLGGLRKDFQPATMRNTQGVRSKKLIQDTCKSFLFELIDRRQRRHAFVEEIHAAPLQRRAGPKVAPAVAPLAPLARLFFYART